MRGSVDHGAFVGDVHLVEECLDALCLQPHELLIPQAGVALEHDDDGALPAECFGDRRADSTSRSGDRADAAVELATR